MYLSYENTFCAHLCFREAAEWRGSVFLSDEAVLRGVWVLRAGASSGLLQTAQTGCGSAESGRRL